MNEDRFADMTSILSFGLGNQNRLADLNKLLTARIKAADYSDVHQKFEELLAIAQETDIKKMAQKEERLDGLNSDLAEMRIELLKEQKLLWAMRGTNDAYVFQLGQEIEEAENYLSQAPAEGIADVITRRETLKKRVQELVTTKSVGISFSEQIKLAEANLTSLSDRIWNVMMNLIPLLRGRLSMEYSRIMVEEIKKATGMESEAEG
ncbi:MAG: toxic anion resistance protein [Lachnospiraceae bacterium]|nr:toxic anion resistance protein [Lachnospiraceae bacterium]